MKKLTKMVASALLTITLLVGGTMLPSGGASAATVNSIGGVPQQDPLNSDLLLVQPENLLVPAGETPTFTSLVFPALSQLFIRAKIAGASGPSSTVFSGVLEAGETETISTFASSDAEEYSFAARFLKSEVDALAADERAPFFSDQPLQIFSVSGWSEVVVLPDGGGKVSPVPLPAALPLLIGALGGLVALRRRKARAA